MTAIKLLQMNQKPGAKLRGAHYLLTYFDSLARAQLSVVLPRQLADG